MLYGCGCDCWWVSGQSNITTCKSFAEDVAVVDGTADDDEGTEAFVEPEVVAAVAAAAEAAEAAVEADNAATAAAFRFGIGNCEFNSDEAAATAVAAAEPDDDPDDGAEDDVAASSGATTAIGGDCWFSDDIDGGIADVCCCNCCNDCNAGDFNAGSDAYGTAIVLASSA